MYEKLTRLIPAIDSATVYGEWVVEGVIGELLHRLEEIDDQAMEKR